MALTVGSLFSGIGGFDLGFERAGMDVRWQCEIDKTAREVLRRHWPDATVYEDVRNVGSGAAAVDVVCGGFPCQDVSVAGRRAGLAGERSGLWFEFHRILAEVTPEWVVIENVPGLLSSNAGRDFATILRGLVELRYGVVWRVLDSQHFGVPQRRRRVFIVGHLGDGRAAEVLFESNTKLLQAVSGGVVCPSLIRNGMVDNGGGRWTGGMVIRDMTGVRRLTPTECARLQGFPDDWNDWLSDSARYKQYGNAVTVTVAEWVGRRIVEVEREDTN
jgi:DNA (cytosine-5)-methyltransferase 1